MKSTPLAGEERVTLTTLGKWMSPVALVAMRRTEPPVASAIGRNRSVSEMTSWNSLELAAPAETSAVWSPCFSR